MNPPKNNMIRPEPSPDVTEAIEQALEAVLEGKIEKSELERAAVGVAQELTVTQTVTQYTGPLPHPKHLQEYENTLPGAADRILKMAEYELSHSSNMEKSILDVTKEDSKRGMNNGTGLFAALIVCAFGSLFVTDNPLVPGIFLGAATVGGITALIRGRG